MVNRRKAIISISIFLVCLILFTIESYADLSLSQSSVSMKKGETKTVTLSATDATGNIVVKSSNASVVTVSAPNWIENNEIAITITAKGEGKASISITGVVADNTGTKETDVNKTISVEVIKESTSNENNGGNTGNTGNSGNTGNQAGNNGGNTTPDAPTTPETPTKSNNANLKNLGIRPNDFSGFTAGKTEYSVTVDNSVEEIEIYAYKQDEKASVSGTGKKSLKEGTNKFNVTVTAEDGTKKTYTLRITRKTAEEEIPPNVIDENNQPVEEKLRLTAIALQEDLELVLNPSFNGEVFEYTVQVEEDVESIEISGIPNINDAKVTIKGNEELVEGENIITLVVSKEGMESVTYTIKVIKKGKEEEPVVTTSVTTTYHSTIPKPFNISAKVERDGKIILVCTVAIVVIGSIIAGWDYRKTKKLVYVSENENLYDKAEEKIQKTELEETPRGKTIELASAEEEEERKPKRGKHF